MPEDEQSIFDEDIIQKYRQHIPDLLDNSWDTFGRLIADSNVPENQLRSSLLLLANTSFRFLPLLFKASAFNMSLLNDMDKVINSLPESFHEIKKEYRSLIRLTKSEHDYVKWATRTHDDLTKDTEKPNGDNNE